MKPLVILLLLSWIVHGAVNIIPQPKQIDVKRSLINLPGAISIRAVHTGDLQGGQLQTYCSNILQKDHGLISQTHSKAGYLIELSLNSDLTVGKEGYQLETDAQHTKIQARTHQGLFYGIQTLRQLVSKNEDGAFTLPRVRINDSPRFPWRGIHLDVSRHFYPKEFIKRYIDYLAMYKMNVFHWHLVDGPGWRIEIKKYPRLTDIGAWRKDKTSEPWNWRGTEINLQGKQPDSYGGYYTQQDIREILAYAKERYVTVVPEIEMPGHSFAILAAYPEFACPTNDIMVDGLRGKDVFCVGNESTYRFLKDILDETMALFPSTYIHIGADEVPTSAWKECPKCQALQKKLKLHDEKSLQSHFVTQMEQYVHSKGRTMMGWDEILEDALPSRAAVTIWRDRQLVDKALQQNRPIVMSPGEFCYFDQYQSQSRQGESPAIGGFLPTRKVYAFDPQPKGISAEQQALILGGQANVWTEYIQTPSQVETRIFPRMCALAEAVWTPTDQKDWGSFERRVQAHRKTWKAKGVSFYPGALDGK